MAFWYDRVCAGQRASQSDCTRLSAVFTCAASVSAPIRAESRTPVTSRVVAVEGAAPRGGQPYLQVRGVSSAEHTRAVSVSSETGSGLSGIGFIWSWDVSNPDSRAWTSRSDHISPALTPNTAISPKTREETDQLMHTRGSNARRPHSPRRARLGECEGGTSKRTPVDPRGSGLTLPG